MSTRTDTPIPYTTLFRSQVHRAMTDRAYVGTDFELAQLIDDLAAEETRKALEDLLLAPNVAGKAGVMLSERSPFRGRTLSGDVDGYITDILAETDKIGRAHV